VCKAPSADLWEGQTDEADLGFSYDDADQILFLMTELGLTEEEVVSRGFDRPLVQAVQRTMHRTAFKRTMPEMMTTVWEATHGQSANH